MGSWMEIALRSFTQPRDAARDLIDRNLGWDIVLSAFIASSCLSTILFFSFDGGQVPEDFPFAAVFQAPLLLVSFFLASGVIVSLGINFVGQLVGGTGTVLHMMLIMAWFQVLQVGIQVVTYALLILIAPAAMLLQFVMFWYGIFIFVAFVAEAYGFENWFKSAVVSLAGFISSIAALAGILSLVLIGG